MTRATSSSGCSRDIWGIDDESVCIGPGARAGRGDRPWRRRAQRAAVPRQLLEQQQRRREQPSSAAIHEAAHEWAAKRAGARDMFAFVRSFEEGGTYMTLGPAYVTLPDGRRVKSVARSLRQRAAIKLAGHVAEDLFHGRDVRNADALPRAEGVTAFDREHCRCDNPALPFFAAALAYLDGDADRARAMAGRDVRDSRSRRRRTRTCTSTAKTPRKQCGSPTSAGRNSARKRQTKCRSTTRV